MAVTEFEGTSGMPDRRARSNPAVLAKLGCVSSGTLSSVLIGRGLRNVVLNGIRPLRPDLHMVGYARTLRILPMREDIARANENRPSVHRLAVEAVERDDVLVIDARGDVRAGCLGDILATRVMQRGGAGVVTDGALLDTPVLRTLDLPTYCRDASPKPLLSAHYAADMDLMIACAGVLVVPGDVVCGDGEAVVVIPAALAASVADEAFELEEFEEFIRRRVQQGASITGLYPPDEETRTAYEQWRRRERPCQEP